MCCTLPRTATTGRLDSEERKLLDAQLERYSGRVMSDKNAAAMATVLMTVAEKAAAMVPAQSQSEGDAPPLVEIGAGPGKRAGGDGGEKALAGRGSLGGTRRAWRGVKHRALRQREADRVEEKGAEDDR